MKMNKKTVLLACGLTLSVLTYANNQEVPVNESNTVATAAEDANVGVFTAEGKTFETKFVRVLFAAEGSERDGESNSIVPLVYDSTDPQGNAVKVRRFQITTKNTGYEEVQTSQEEDYKLKSVQEGAKLHVEIPVAEDGTLHLDKAYLGNAAYNFGTRETRQNLSPDNSSDLKLKITKLDLPTYGADAKPGDKGLIYNDGAIQLTFSAKVKHIASDDISDFTVSIDGPISVTHIRGKEREKAATSISPEMVAKNIK